MQRNRHYNRKDEMHDQMRSHTPLFFHMLIPQPLQKWTYLITKSLQTALHLLSLYCESLGFFHVIPVLAGEWLSGSKLLLYASCHDNKKRKRKMVKRKERGHDKRWCIVEQQARSRQQSMRFLFGSLCLSPAEAVSVLVCAV